MDCVPNSLYQDMGDVINKYLLTECVYEGVHFSQKCSQALGLRGQYEDGTYLRL